MARLHVRLSGEQVDRLFEVFSLDAAALTRLAGALNERKGSIRASELRTAADSAIGPSGSRAVATLLYWSGFARQNGLKETALLDGIERALAAITLSEEQKRLWQTKKDAFLNLLSLSAAYQSAKSLDLGYDFPRFATGTRIVTDLRPTFSRNDEDVAGLIICQTLRIDFIDSQGRNSFTVALDSEDIARLREACDRALLKSKAATTLANRSLQKASFVNGEEHYDVS